MAGHAQLKCVMTECSKTQIRLTGLKWKYGYQYFHNAVKAVQGDFQFTGLPLQIIEIQGNITKKITTDEYFLYDLSIHK